MNIKIIYCVNVRGVTRKHDLSPDLQALTLEELDEVLKSYNRYGHGIVTLKGAKYEF